MRVKPATTQHTVGRLVTRSPSVGVRRGAFRLARRIVTQPDLLQAERPDCFCDTACQLSTNRGEHGRCPGDPGGVKASVLSLTGGQIASKKRRRAWSSVGRQEASWPALQSLLKIPSVSLVSHVHRFDPQRGRAPRNSQNRLRRVVLCQLHRLSSESEP